MTRRSHRRDTSTSPFISHHTEEFHSSVWLSGEMFTPQNDSITNPDLDNYLWRFSDGVDGELRAAIAPMPPIGNWSKINAEVVLLSTGSASGDEFKFRVRWDATSGSPDEYVEVVGGFSSFEVIRLLIEDEWTPPVNTVDFKMLSVERLGDDAQDTYTGSIFLGGVLLYDADAKHALPNEN